MASKSSGWSICSSIHLKYGLLLPSALVMTSNRPPVTSLFLSGFAAGELAPVLAATGRSRRAALSRVLSRREQKRFFFIGLGEKLAAKKLRDIGVGLRQAWYQGCGCRHARANPCFDVEQTAAKARRGWRNPIQPGKDAFVFAG